MKRKRKEIKRGHQQNKGSETHSRNMREIFQATYFYVHSLSNIKGKKKNQMEGDEWLQMSTVCFQVCYEMADALPGMARSIF